MKVKTFLAPTKILCGLILFALLPVFSHAASFSATLDHSVVFADDGQPGGRYTLTWTAVDPSTDDATVTYYVFEEYGKDSVDAAGSLPADLANAAYATREASLTFDSGTGSRCFVVVSSDSANGPAFSTLRKCHDFVHGSAEGTTIARTDGDGTERGVDQKWTFTYYMDADAYVTAKILPPGTTFTVDANLLVIAASSAPVRTLVEATGPPNPARPGEGGAGSISNSEVWDSRSSTGVVVTNGVYYLWVQAYLDRGQLFPQPAESISDATPETYLRDGKVITIPVDIIRVMNLTATAITLTNTRSTISYFITADALVRVLIARPGSRFTVDSSGDVQPTDSSGTIDPTLIVSTFSFQRKAGTNSETWDGTSSSGTVMASGVYAVAISATDDFGNHAIDLSGNDFPVYANITLERAAGSTSGGSTSSDTSAPSLTATTADGAAFSDGALFTGSVSTITVQLTDTASGIGFGTSNISVVGPNSQSISGTLSNNSADTMTFIFATPQNTNGVYTMTITAVDGIGNSTTYTRTFVISIQLSQSAFENGFRLYPNPTKNATSATIEYDVSEAATVSIEIFNILGEKVYSASYVQSTAQSNVTRTWLLTNNDGEKVGSGLYLVRIKAVGASNTVEVTKKIVVIR